MTALLCALETFAETDCGAYSVGWRRARAANSHKKAIEQAAMTPKNVQTPTISTLLGLTARKERMGSDNSSDSAEKPLFSKNQTRGMPTFHVQPHACDW